MRGFPLLALESSCDETAAAVVGADGRLLGEALRTQIDVHRAFGGVVPEIASRAHVEALPQVVAEALGQAGIALEDVGGVAATAGPGLVGCLLVALSWAQGFAAARGLPFLGVHHLEGHLLAPFVGQATVPSPLLALIVSGGHTALARWDDGAIEVLGETRDDAAGEAFDKSARALDLPYPGGILVDRLADDGDPAVCPLPRASRLPGYEFSYSGLKTAVWQQVQRDGVPQGQALADLCASLREAIVDPLVDRTRRAAAATGIADVVVTGGVAANRLLRARMAAAAAEDGFRLHLPQPQHCTDNAAMIAAAARWRMLRGEVSPLSIDARPGWALGAT